MLKSIFNRWTSATSRQGRPCSATSQSNHPSRYQNQNQDCYFCHYHHCLTNCLTCVQTESWISKSGDLRKVHFWNLIDKKVCSANVATGAAQPSSFRSQVRLIISGITWGHSEIWLRIQISSPKVSVVPTCPQLFVPLFSTSFQLFHIFQLFLHILLNLFLLLLSSSFSSFFVETFD